MYTSNLISNEKDTGPEFTAHGRDLLSPVGPLFKLTLVTNHRISTPFVYVCGGRVLHTKERRKKMKKGKNLRGNTL